LSLSADSDGRATLRSGISALAAFALASPAFHDGGTIPRLYTCDGRDVSPPLRWTAPPPGTRSLTLTVTDPDAPGGGFVHWRVTAIAPRAASVAQGRRFAHEQRNSFGANAYGGPCPPHGPPHNYVFVLQALDARGHVLATARLVGRYARA
jgi:Raf kinase inhibitor-like YbhB/YbcL family protein